MGSHLYPRSSTIIVKNMVSMKLSCHVELGLCPQHIFGLQIHVEHAFIWNRIQLRIVMTLNNILAPKGIL